MTADHLIGIEHFEAGLWKVADNLRANSNLASNEYFMPILGPIFLRRATNCYYAARAAAVEALRRTRHFVHQADWLQERFPDARLRDVEGVVKLIELGGAEAHDWSLTPGRYVGVAPEEEDEDFDFEEAMWSIHMDLNELNEEAAELAARIARNFEELGV